MSLRGSELIVKVTEEGVRMEVDVFSLILTSEGVRVLIKKLENALFEARQLEREKRKKMNGG